MSNGFDMSGFEKLQKDLQKLQRESPKTCQKTSNDLAARTLRLVKKRTPVGDYSGDSYACSVKKELTHKGHYEKDKTGGTLRRKWIVQKGINAGGTYVNYVINPIEYAPYVEYGHMTVGKKKSWVKGHFMLTESLEDLKRIAPKVIQKNVDAMMKEVFG